MNDPLHDIQPALGLFGNTSSLTTSETIHRNRPIFYTSWSAAINRLLCYARSICYGDEQALADLRQHRWWETDVLASIEWQP
ncbi:hypothetical protein V3C99_009499 [Haemonchus contortus]